MINPALKKIEAVGISPGFFERRASELTTLPRGAGKRASKLTPAKTRGQLERLEKLAHRQAIKLTTQR